MKTPPNSGPNQFNHSLLARCAGVISTASLQADVLLSYDMQTLVSELMHLLLAVASLRQASLEIIERRQPHAITIGTATTDFYTAWAFIGSGGSTAANAITSGDYFKLTLTPTAGNSITVSSLSFDIFAATAGPSARQLYVFSDKTGIAGGSELFTDQPCPVRLLFHITRLLPVRTFPSICRLCCIGQYH